MNNVARIALLAALAATALALSTASHAASGCKGLEASRCTKDATCTWVDGYTTKSGNKVNGYCRSKGGKPADAKSAAAAPKAVTTAAKKSGAQ